MAKVATSVPIQTYSRFALLEEESDESDDDKKEIADKKNNAAKNAKKRARRKKKAAASTNELRNLAFSKPVSAKAIQNVHHERHAQTDADGNILSNSPLTATNNHPTENVDIADRETWKNKDEEFVVNQFQRDLENALRVSSEYAPGPQVSKLKKKVKTMSLDEFVEREREAAAIMEQAPPPIDNFYVPNGYSPEDIDPNHYDTFVDDIAPPIQQTTAPTPQKKKKKKKKPTSTENGNSLSDVLQELHTHELPQSESTPPTTNGCSIDAASIASYENVITEKDKEITRLLETNESLKDELAQVKKRNKQFCFILAQGEMKEKSEILLQVDELTNVKNELSEELADMHTQLEQERSKVSSLKVELTKAQNQRSKTKSFSDEF